MAKKRNNLETTLQEAMKKSGLSTYELAEISEVSQPIIWRFLTGQRTVTLPTASKLAEALDLELKPKSRKKGR